MDIISYLSKNRDCYNLSYVERECGIPVGLLRAVLKGRKKMSDKHVKKLVGFFRGIAFEYKHTPHVAEQRITPEKVGKLDGLIEMKTGEWKPSLRGYWTNGVLSKIPVTVKGKRYYEG